MNRQAMKRVERALRDARKLVKNWTGKEPQTDQAISAGCATFRMTDMGNAERLLLRFQDRLRYVTEATTWAFYDGKRWDMTGGELAAQTLAQETVRAIYLEVDWVRDVNVAEELVAHADRSASARNTKGLLEQARSLFACSILDFDSPATGDLFNVANGTLNLRTGKLRPHNPNDMLTRLCPVAYRCDATAPRFVQFIGEVCVDENLKPDAEKEAFLQRALGYSLFGTNEEQKAFFIPGRSNDQRKNGENGKSVLQNTVKSVCGDYFTATDRRLICEDSRGEVDPKHNAPLMGRRIAFGSELLKTDTIHAQNFKNLTGEDEVPAKLLYRDEVNFENLAALWFLTNHMPFVANNDGAVYRRIVIIPFLNKFYAPADCPPGGFVRDNSLKQKLKAEKEGILAWLVRGALEYTRRGGLDVPERMKHVRDRMRAEYDPIGEWEKRCVIYDADAIESASALFESARNFNRINGEADLTATKFGRMMNDRTVEKIDRNPETGKMYRATMRKGARLTETGRDYLNGKGAEAGQMSFTRTVS